MTFDGAGETTSCAIRSMPGRNRTRHRALGGRPGKQTDLGDFGADAGVVDPPPVRVPADVADADEVGRQHAQDVCEAALAAGADGGIAPSSMLRAFLPSGTWPEVPPS